jgi:hypothetical protein
VLEFTVFTDNNPLTYVFSTAKLNATGHRWVAELADLNFKVNYLAGKKNIEADALLRLPDDMDTYMRNCTEEATLDGHKDLKSAKDFGDEDGCAVWINALTANPLTVYQELENTGVQEPLKSVSTQEIKTAQKEDEIIRRILDFMSRGKVPNSEERKGEKPRTLTLLRQWGKLRVDQDGILRRKNSSYDQLVLPEKYRHIVYDELHKKMGHLGADRV